MEKVSTFVIVSEFGELLELATHLKYVEKQDVYLAIPNHDYSEIGKGIVDRMDEWWMCLGEGYVWVFDGCAQGKLQDWLRSKGEWVVGGSAQGDRLENERQLGQNWFKKAGFYQPVSKNFKDIDSAIKFVLSNSDKKWVLKQNGDAPKSINHVGKFDGNEDMVFHLEELKSKWNESEFGKFDCDLMEKVEGLEVAASAFFNGKEFLKNSNGKVTGFLNFECKKESEGNMGQTTGEMGTTFIGVDESNKLFSNILLNPKIVNVLQASKFRGVFDINCIQLKDGRIVGLEPTMRFGIPATSYEFMEGLDMPTWELLAAMAKGLTVPIKIHTGPGMVMVVAAKPFPVEADMESAATSIGEKLWILKDGKPVKDFDEEQRKHIHLENIKKDGDNYLVATKNGYILTVTGREGKTIQQVRENLIDYIKSNVYLTDFKIRHDIGQNVIDYYAKK